MNSQVYRVCASLLFDESYNNKQYWKYYRDSCPFLCLDIKKGGAFSLSGTSATASYINEISHLPKLRSQKQNKSHSCRCWGGAKKLQSSRLHALVSLVSLFLSLLVKLRLTVSAGGDGMDGPERHPSNPLAPNLFHLSRVSVSYKKRRVYGYLSI